jgi:anti-sigma B factor antagonist
MQTVKGRKVGRLLDGLSSSSLPFAWSLIQRGWGRARMPNTPDEGQQAVDPLFTIKSRREGDATIIAVSGELDRAATDQLDTAIRDGEKAATESTVIDLDELSFMDSTVLTVLIQARSRARGDGSHLRFVLSRHDQVQRILSVTGAIKMFS